MCLAARVRGSVRVSIVLSGSVVWDAQLLSGVSPVARHQSSTRYTVVDAVILSILIGEDFTSSSRADTASPAGQGLPWTTRASLTSIRGSCGRRVGGPKASACGRRGWLRWTRPHQGPLALTRQSVGVAAGVPVYSAQCHGDEDAAHRLAAVIEVHMLVSAATDPGRSYVR